MNSVLQCLAHTAPLANYFGMAEPAGRTLSKFTTSFQDLLRAMWSGGSVVDSARFLDVLKWHAIDAFKATYARHDANAHGGVSTQQHDASEFLDTIRNKIESETPRTNGVPNAGAVAGGAGGAGAHASGSPADVFGSVVFGAAARVGDSFGAAFAAVGFQQHQHQQRMVPPAHWTHHQRTWRLRDGGAGDVGTRISVTEASALFEQQQLLQNSSLIATAFRGQIRGNTVCKVVGGCGLVSENFEPWFKMDVGLGSDGHPHPVPTVHQLVNDFLDEQNPNLFKCPKCKRENACARTFAVQRLVFCHLLLLLLLLLCGSLY